jgi:glycosylphosphatidylinositol transamidase (GPIT) subunit GPI8
MQEKFRSLEIAVNHMEFLMRLHQRAISKHPGNYSSEFQNGQRLIFKDFFPAVEEVRSELEKIKEEEVVCQRN